MSTQEKVNILMVDDQPAKLLTYEAILDELGENLIKASSGKAALEHLLKTDIGVVLMDVSMPELDGFQLAEMIREHPRFQKTAIIFISGVHMTAGDYVKGYAKGAVDYISVPVIPEILRAKVSVFADLYRKTRQLERLNDELRVLSSRLITMQDDERRRIARELHDGLGQELVAAKLLLDRIVRHETSPAHVKDMGETSQIIDRAIQQVRSMSHLLHPPLLDEVGLQSALRWYLTGITKRSGIETELEVEPSDFPRLGPELETAIFRVIQEALTNVFRHSEARHAWVTLCCQDGGVTATIRDDGKGIGAHIAGLQPGNLGVGIGGMKQRAEELGGSLRLTRVDPGTMVEVTIPCGHNVSQEAKATA